MTIQVRLAGELGGAREANKLPQSMNSDFRDVGQQGSYDKLVFITAMVTSRV